MSDPLQHPAPCSVPACSHAHDLECALMSIASGGLRPVRRERRVAPYGHPGVTVVDEAFHERAGLWEELQTTIGRLSRSASSSGPSGKASERPVPYHEFASAVAHRLRNELSTWARTLLEDDPELVPPADHPPSVARWLVAQLVGRFVSAELGSGIRSAVRDAQRVIDRAPDRVYAGPCYEPLEDDGEPTESAEPAEAEDGEGEEAGPKLCAGQLYALVGEDVVRCPTCGTRHLVEVRQEWLSSRLGDQHVSAAEAAPVLSWLLGKSITRNNIAAWRRDNRVEVHAGPYPYLFSDLMVLGREMKPRASRRTEGGGSAA